MVKLFGITGGIGSGKSVIAKKLQEFGYKVYDTDNEAQRIMRQNPAVRSQIELIFGSDIYDGDALNRQEVARQIFACPELRDKINRAVHPAVGFELQQWVKQQDDICFVESAILFESHLNSLCNAVVCICAPIDIRIVRTINRDNATKEQVLDRINSQMTDEQRTRLSDMIIINDGTKEISDLCLQILDFCRNFAAKPTD